MAEKRWKNYFYYQDKERYGTKYGKLKEKCVFLCLC